MKFNKYLLCALFLVLICCIGAASAADTGDDVVAVNDTIDGAVSEAVDVSDEIDEEPLGVSEEPALSEGETPSSSEKVIYVGTNGTDGGDGSYDNPYTTIKSAWENANDKDSITIKIFEGTYRFGEGFSTDANTPLKFDTNNLNIIGINGPVTITNYYWDDNGLNPEWFALTSSSANLFISNIIFEVPDNYKVYTYIDSSEGNGFLPFYGTVNSAIFENCTFRDNAYTNFPYYTGPNTKFINCKFDVNQDQNLFNNPYFRNSNLSFEYCIMNINSKVLGAIYLPTNISMKNMCLDKMRFLLISVHLQEDM